MRARALVLACASLASTSCGGDARATDTRDSTHAPAALASVSDDAKIATLRVLNHAEIDGAQDASTKASNAELRAFATQLVRDHQMLLSATDSLWRQADSARSQTVDAVAISRRSRELSDSLSRLSGSAYDLTYLDAQVSDHQMALQLLSGWQAQTSDARLARVLRDARPVVQAHYDHALSLQSRLMPTTDPSVWKKHLGIPAV